MEPLPLIFTVLGLVLASGIFTLFDSALVLCRRSRLEKENGKFYMAVLAILDKEKNILFACRIWINILRIFAAFFTGFFAMRYLQNTQVNGILTVLIIIISVFILSLISALLGDALPKLLSRTKPEKIAAALLPVIKFFSVPMAPFIKPAVRFETFFNSTFHAEISENSITEEELQNELRNTLMEGEKSGIVESSERTMLEGVFYLGDRPVGAFMTHRSEIAWLDCNAPYSEIRKTALKERQQRCFPVANGSPDAIIGAVYLEDIIIDYAQAEPLGIRAIMKKAHFVPETMSALKAFESFKQGQANFLFVMDEYGGLSGIISITALVEEIVGELSAPVQEESPLIKQEDGTWLADGTLNIDDAALALGLTGLGEDSDFHTLAGFVLFLAGELPRVGDCYDYQGFRFKVIDKDGNRIDKLLISKLP
ncbi:MAG: hemolysin family protein [Treponema sp.]|jgi:putative hemolysin|nr:hemolysin family protein [Treponema sp.]